MSAGYELSWAKKAVADLDDLNFYLSMHFGEREVGVFFRKLDARIQLISTSPLLFPESKSRTGLRKCVVTKYTVIYYQLRSRKITIVAILDSRRNALFIRER